MDRSRLEAFSDGVFAVAITLLALDITVEGPGHGRLIDQLGAQWPALVAYLISFFTIGIIWVNHHSLLRSVRSVDRTLLFLNLLLLLFVVLIPFSTSTAADYLTQNDADARVAMALYAGVFFGMSVGFGSMLEWTLRSDRVFEPVPPERRWAARVRFAGGAGVYALALILAFFSAYASFILDGLIGLYYIAERTPGSPGGSSGAPGEDEIAVLVRPYLDSCH